jgi:hypothetical protein
MRFSSLVLLFLPFCGKNSKIVGKPFVCQEGPKEDYLSTVKLDSFKHGPAVEHMSLREAKLYTVYKSCSMRHCMLSFNTTLVATVDK